MGIRVDYGPTLGQVEFPDSMSEEQVREYVSKYDSQFRESLAIRARQPAMKALAEAETAEENVSESPLLAMGAAAAGQLGSIGDFVRLGTKLNSPAATLAEATGLGDYLRSFKVARELPRATPSLADVGQAYEERGVLDAAREAGALVAGNIVEQTPNIVGTVATGSLLGMAQVPARAAAIAAPFATTFPIEAGGAFEEIEQRTGRADAATALTALGVGGINAAIEAASEAPILSSAMAPAKKVAGRFLGDSILGAAGRTALGAAGEGLAEAGQEVTTAMAPELFGAERDPNLGMRIAEAGVAGAAAGAPFTAASVLQGRIDDAREARQRQADLDEALLAGRAAQEFGLQRNAIIQQAAQAEQAAVVQFTRTLDNLDQQAAQIPIRTPFEHSRIAAELAAAKLDALTDFTQAKLATSGVVRQVDEAQAVINGDAAAKVEAAVAAVPPAPPATPAPPAPAPDAPSPKSAAERLAQILSQGEQVSDQELDSLFTIAAPAYKTSISVAARSALTGNPNNMAALRILSSPLLENDPSVGTGYRKRYERLLQETPVPQAAPPKVPSYGAMEGRIFLPVPVNGVPMLFYKSSKGTSGKTARNWYPAFGAGVGDWIVKGTTKEMEQGYGIPEVKAVMDQLNRDLPGSYEDTLAALKVNVGDPVGFRQIATQTYGPEGVNQRIGVGPDGQIDNATGVRERINQVLDRVRGSASATPTPPAAVAMGAEAVSAGLPPQARSRRQAVVQSAAQQLAALEGQERFPAAPRPEAPESLLSPTVEAQLRAARERDLAARQPPTVEPPPLEAIIAPESVAAMKEATTPPPDANQVQAPVAVPTGTPVTPVQQVAEERPPVVRKPSRVSEEEFARAAKKKGGRRKLGDVRERVGEAGLRKKDDVAAVNKAIVSLEDLTPGEALQREYDQASAVLKRRRRNNLDLKGIPIPTLPDGATDTNKTRYLRFLDEVDQIIESHPKYGIIAMDENAKATVRAKVIKYAAQSFAKAQKSGEEWALNFAVAKAKSDTFQAIGNITGSEEWKGMRSQPTTLEVETDEGSFERPLPEQDQMSDPADDGRRLMEIVSDAAAIASGEGIKVTPQWTAALFYRAAVSSMGEMEAQERLAGIPDSVIDLAESPDVERIFQAHVIDQIGDIRLSIAKNLKFAIGEAQVREALEAAFGAVPANVTVIDDPNHILPDGRSGPIAGYVSRSTGNVVINAAYIDSAQTAVRTVMEEFGHIVFKDPAVAQAWETVKAEVTAEDIEAARKEGYSDVEALEEAALENVLRHLDGIRPPTTAIQNFLNSLWDTLKSLLGFGNKYDQAKNQILRRIVEVIRDNQVESRDSDIRLSRADGWFVNQRDASIAIAEAQARGGEGVETMVNVAQLEGELIPRTVVNETERMAKGSRVERIAANALKLITEIGNLAEGSWLSAFPQLFPTARTVLDIPEASGRELAAEAVVRAHLALGEKRSKIALDLKRAEQDLAAAIAQLPKIQEDLADGRIAEIEGQTLINGLEVMLQNQLATARGKEVIDSQEVAELLDAASKLSEAKRAITPAIGNALSAIAREIPDSVTGEGPILQWVGQRLRDKSLPPLMSDTVAKFLTTPIAGRRLPPITQIKIHEVIASLKELRDARITANAELEQFKKDFHGGKTTPTGKGRKVRLDVAAERFASLRQTYRNAISQAKKLDKRIAGLEARVAGLNLALTTADQMFRSLPYQKKLEAAARTINAMDSAIKLTTGKRTGSGIEIDGTVSMVDPLTNEAVSIPLNPLADQVAKAQDNIKTLLAHIAQFLGENPDADPLVRIRLERDTERLKDMLGGSKWYLKGMIPKWVPIIGGIDIPSLATLHTRIPIFGKRLASPNNIISWVGGPAGRELPAIMNARDVVGRMLENLRDEQRQIDLLTVQAMKAHGLDPRNHQHQKDMASHISRIQSQYQNPGSRPYKIGERNGIGGMEVLPQDMQLALYQKSFEDKVQEITKKALPKGVTRNLFNDFQGITEVFKGRSITRSSANYGMKMSRRSDMDGRTVVERWLNAKTKPEQVALLDQFFTTLVLGLALETDPTLSLKVESLDRELFNELVSLERQGALPFSDFTGFMDWISDRWARENGTTEVEEREAALDRLIRYTTTLAGRYAEDAAQKAKGGEDVSVLNEVRDASPAVISALTGDNQFTRPRGALNGPSTWYAYDLTGTTAQESYKGNLANVFLVRELAGWMNLRKALKNALFDFDRRKAELVKAGKSERDALRQLQIESREKAKSIRNEADYATVRDVAQFVDALIAELNRIGNERIEAPADTGPARTGKAVVGLAGANLLTSGASMISNAQGPGIMGALIASWLNRLRIATAGPAYYAGMVKTLTGRALQLLGQKVGWFGAWLKTNGSVVNAINGLIADAALSRQRAMNALVLDQPDVKTLVKLIAELPGSYGSIDPGRPQESVEWFVNILQAGFPPSLVRQYTPARLHGALDAASKLIPTGVEQIKRFAPGTLDRAANTVTAQLYNRLFDDPAFKRRAYEILSRKKALDPTLFNRPESKVFEILDDQWEGVLGAPGVKFLRDVTAPLGSLESILNEWFAKVDGRPDLIATTPLLSEQDQEALSLQFMKLTNLRTESSRPPALKGKGLGGFWRNLAFQFSGYGQNLAGVLERRWAAVSGGGDDKLSRKWLHGLAFLLIFLMHVIFGAEMKGFYRELIEREPRTQPAMASAAEDPQIAARYLSAAVASQLPYFGDQLQKIAGGTAPSSPFDLTRSIPMLGLGTAAYDAMIKASQSGDAVYPMLDFLRQAAPLSKIPINWASGGDVMRREAYRGVRANAPSSIEMREFSGGGGRSTPMQPLVRDAINAYLDGDMAGYREAYNKAIQYQVSTGKDRTQAEQAVKSAISARDPLRSTIGRPATPAEEQAIVRRLTPRQRNAFLRARSLTKSLEGGRGRSRTSPFRKRRQKAKRRSWSQA